ncbi:hypothetical protein COO60DRAFT_769299 [Scenedesmus sp. NREL 46B-D3]|nr:hypothetical protein COO60DRAFT_769299 [Scenedesmus sp. NREL 46B-D3]
MNPEMMKFAMEQMQRMSPEQMQAMMSGMGGMNPGMMQEAMQQMNNMSPADMAAMKRQVDGMDSAALASRAQEAQKMMSAREKYVLDGSNQLKAEGNKLHAAGQYADAAEKYARAKQNMAEFAGPESAALRKACVLNLGSCYLNLGRYQQCVAECQEALQGDPRNLKALYRRGQAYAALQQHVQAEQDLEVSLELSGNDPQQQQLIREKLQSVREKLAAEQRQRQLPQDGAGGDGAAAAKQEEDGLIEEVEEDGDGEMRRAAEDVPELEVIGEPAMQQQQQQQPGSRGAAQRQAAAASGNNSNGAAGSGGLAAMQAQAADMMRANPDFVSQAAEMMKGMSPEQMAAMSRQAGHPLDASAIADAQRHMAAMSPSQVAAMARLAALGPQARESPAAMAQAAEVSSGSWACS